LFGRGLPRGGAGMGAGGAAGANAQPRNHGAKQPRTSGQPLSIIYSLSQNFRFFRFFSITTVQ
jgi:hypothetical protein